MVFSPELTVLGQYLCGEFENRAQAIAEPARYVHLLTYQVKTRQVALGFEATPDAFLSYDKGIDAKTGQSIWGALWGPFEFVKRQDFAPELPF